ncbi:hypothetical protein GOBAR_DD17721 [Gossypium barbadense]|nr:hypothetical protein GOBAR_DD17721 [Gossypium barbadense]
MEQRVVEKTLQIFKPVIFNGDVCLLDMPNSNRYIKNNNSWRHACPVDAGFSARSNASVRFTGLMAKVAIGLGHSTILFMK